MSSRELPLLGGTTLATLAIGAFFIMSENQEKREANFAARLPILNQTLANDGIRAQQKLSSLPLAHMPNLMAPPLTAEVLQARKASTHCSVLSRGNAFQAVVLFEEITASLRYANAYRDGAQELNCNAYESHCQQYQLRLREAANIYRQRHAILSVCYNQMLVE